MGAKIVFFIIKTEYVAFMIIRLIIIVRLYEFRHPSIILLIATSKKQRLRTPTKPLDILRCVRKQTCDMTTNVDVFVGNDTLIDPDIYQLWLNGHSGRLMKSVAHSKVLCD